MENSNWISPLFKNQFMLTIISLLFPAYELCIFVGMMHTIHFLWHSTVNYDIKPYGIFRPKTIVILHSFGKSFIGVCSIFVLGVSILMLPVGYGWFKYNYMLFTLINVTNNVDQLDATAGGFMPFQFLIVGGLFCTIYYSIFWCFNIKYNYYA